MDMDPAPNFSAKGTLGLLLMFSLGLVIVVAVTCMAMVSAETALPHAESLVVPEVIRDCIPNYADCMDIHGTKPCCRQQKLRVGQTVREDFICFRFGVGKCQPLSSVDKLETYAQLMKFANATNLFRLLGQYYKHKILLRKHHGKTE
ncbi:cysteine motif protein 6 [Diadegma semiclausum ichnovirus]|nr:cysteine motif protein 6 [Diadegma semiclausum ichnovirus]